MTREVPKGWALATLGDLVAPSGLFVDGDWVESKDQDPAGEVRLTQLADVGDGAWRDRSERFLTAERAQDLRCTFLEVGDVLVARMPEPLGRACLFPGDPRQCVTVVDVAVIRPGTPEIDPRWLMHCVNSPDCRGQIEAMKAGTTRKRVSRKNLATVLVLVPPASEQRRIVTELERRLSHLQVAEAGLVRSRQLLVAARRSVLNAVASGSLIGADSSTWESQPAGDTCDVRGGIQKQPKRKPANNSFPFLRVANVGRGSLDLTEVHEIELFGDELETYRLQAGDLLVVEGNGSVDQIGRASLWRAAIPDCVHQNHLIRVRPGPKLVPEFLALVWNAPAVVEQLKAVASSTSGLHTLSTGKVKSVQIPVPSRDEQLALVAEAERRLSLIDAAERSVAKNMLRVGQLRRSLLGTAFAGELVSQDPSEEAAATLLERIRVERDAAGPRTKRTKNKETVA